MTIEWYQADPPAAARPGRVRRPRRSRAAEAPVIGLPRAALVAPLWQRFRARLRAFLGRGRLRAECATCARLGPGVRPELLRVFHAAHETVERYARRGRAAAAAPERPFMGPRGSRFCACQGSNEVALTTVGDPRPRLVAGRNRRSGFRSPARAFPGAGDTHGVTEAVSLPRTPAYSVDGRRVPAEMRFLDGDSSVPREEFESPTRGFSVRNSSALPEELREVADSDPGVSRTCPSPQPARALHSATPPAATA